MKIKRRSFLTRSAPLALVAGIAVPAGVAAQVKTAGERTTVFNILEYGAVGDGHRLETRAILTAIETCARAGGGTVFVPAGKYLTGAIALRSNVNLYLDSGAMLLGSTNPAEYPVYSSPWPGGAKMISPLIYGDKLDHVSITGRGTIDGQGHAWWLREWLRKPRRRVPVPEATPEERAEAMVAIQNGRPRLIHLSHCRDVLIEGVTLTNSPFWTIHPIFCQDVTITGVTIRNPVPSPNTDGIDPESCRYVHISNCVIDVGDDCIAIKAGKNAVGREVGMPCENITITNLTTAHGHGGVSIGSEMSGGVRNVSISNCVFDGTDQGIRIKTQRGRGGVVDSVVASNIVMRNVPAAFTITAFYSRGDVNSIAPVDAGTPRLRDFRFSNVVARGSRTAGTITGLREMPVEDVAFSGLLIDADRGFSVENARRLALCDARIGVAKGPALEARNVRGLELGGIAPRQVAAGSPVFQLENVQDVFAHGCNVPPGTTTFMRVSGARSARIALRANNLARPSSAVALVDGAEPAILSQP